MKIKTILISSVAIAATVGTAQSCMAIATSSFGLNIIKKILLGGITKSLGIFKNKQAFLENDLIDQAMPSQLRSINNILSQIAPGLVAKEKDYIAQAAAYTVNISEPILINAVNSLTADDVTRIANGAPGTATQVLKEKSASQIAAAIMPKVDEKLNQFGIVSSINTALQGSNLLGSIFGNNHQGAANVSATGGLSRYASEQMVDGLFNLIENYERQNSAEIKSALGK